MTDRKGLGMERYELVVRENPFDGGAYAEAVVTEDGNYTLYADAQATVEALQAVIRQMGEQAAVLAKDGMAAKAQVEALQAQLPAEMQGCTILFKECEKGHGRLVATNWRDHGCQTCEVEALQREHTQLQARVRELEQPVYVCQGCGRLGRDGWLPTSFTSDELRGSVQCPDCGCIDREKNTARELAAICTKAQSELAQRTADLEALQRERDRLRANLINCSERLAAYYGDNYPAVVDARAALTPAGEGRNETV